jgi:hypothetical protein
MTRAQRAIRWLLRRQARPTAGLRPTCAAVSRLPGRCGRRPSADRSGTSEVILAVLLPSWHEKPKNPELRSRGEPHGARRAIGHLAADPFFLAGASWWTAVTGAIALRASSANFRWPASICSAKS